MWFGTGVAQTLGKEKGGENMKTLKAAVLASVVGGSLLLSGPSHAAFRGGSSHHGHVASGIRSDRANIHHDLGDLRNDRSDRQDLRQDRRDGTSRGDIKEERRDIRENTETDRGDLRQDRRDLRQDLR